MNDVAKNRFHKKYSKTIYKKVPKPHRGFASEILFSPAKYFTCRILILVRGKWMICDVPWSIKGRWRVSNE